MTAFATPFAKELRTNYVPSPQDRDIIKSLLIEPQERLVQLEAKISEIEQVLDTLKQERHVLSDEIQQHHHLLTPIRRLPDDMLREIFLACLPDTHNAVMDCKEAPLLLGLVCSRWRCVAYNTPNLWATLHIPHPSLRHGGSAQSGEAQISEAYDGHAEEHVTAVWHWLMRSGSCPLSLSFQVPLDHSDGRLLDPIFGVYLSLILHFSQRWHSLELNIPAGPAFNSLASIPITSIPILTHLHLKFSTRMSRAEAEEWKTSGLLHARRLRTVDINNVPFSPSYLPANCWSHLSSLNLIHVFDARKSFANIREAYDVLSRCTRLTHCVLDIFGGSSGWIPPGVLSLPFLKSLSIIDVSRSTSTLFESFAALPELRAISYHNKEHPSPERPPPLITLLIRTSQVTYLSSDFTAFTPSDLSTMFALLPNLTHLVDESSRISTTRSNLLGNSTVEKVSLDLLALPLNNGEMHCPRLRTVHFDRVNNLSDATILSFIQSRMRASKSPTGNVEPLREFRTKLSRPMDIDIRAELLDYVEDGTLKLDLVYPHRHMRNNLLFDPYNGLVKRVLHSGML